MAAELAALQADVVVLQEAPRLVLWRLARRRLARRAGLRLVTTGRAGGNALLAAPEVEVRSSYAVLLPKRPGLHRRASVGAVVTLDGRELVVAGSHLDLDGSARLDSARRVRAAVPPGRPLVLGADVNEPPDGPAWAVLAGGLVDPGGEPTFPAGRPTRRIDLLAVSPELTVALRVLPTAASDHRMLVADVAWAPTLGG